MRRSNPRTRHPARSVVGIRTPKSAARTQCQTFVHWFDRMVDATPRQLLGRSNTMRSSAKVPCMMTNRVEEPCRLAVDCHLSLPDLKAPRYDE